MLKSNAEWLVPEIMDVIRLFEEEGTDFVHYFYFASGTYINCIEYKGNVSQYSYSAETADEVAYKRYACRSAKLAFYELLSALTGKTFPYGALTGIRPTKLAYMEREEGRDPAELLRTMHVAEDNIAFVQRVLKVQQPYYRNRGGQELFISLPFCPTKCAYCSFITAPISATKGYVEAYISCVERELAALRPILSDVRSVYIGGGTPFVLEEGELARIYAAVNALGLPPCEYTVEAGRPDVFTEGKLKLSKDFGVTRVCVNPQSFSDETLKKIGRRHTAAQTFQAYEMAAKYGFDINIDLIAGLEGESVEDFASSLGSAISLRPANITVHTLSLKAGAKLKEDTRRLHIEGIGGMIALSRSMLFEAGYSPYYMYRQKYQAGGHENCGWSLPGRECVYNIGVMEEIADNVAVGANAISKRVFARENRIERLASPKDIPTYINKCDKLIADRAEFFGR